MTPKEQKKGLAPRIIPEDFTNWSWHGKPKKVEQPLGEEKPWIPVSSVYGRIDTMVLFFPIVPEYRRRADRLYVKFIKDFMSNFNGSNRLFVLVVENELTLSDSLQQGLHNYARVGKNTLKILPIQYGHDTLTVWARDAFWARMRSRTDEKVALQLVRPKRKNGDVDIVPVLASRLNDVVLIHANKGSVTSYNAPFSFEGGNMLVSDRFILLGTHGIPTKDLPSKELLEDFWGKPVILFDMDCVAFYNKWRGNRRHVIGNGIAHYYTAASERQPIYHMDLFVSLAGTDEEGREVFVIGKPVCGFDLSEALEETKEAANKTLPATGQAIEELIKQLKADLQALNIDYRIVRNNLPLTYYDMHSSPNTSGDCEKKRLFAWASHNNALVEHYTEQAPDGTTKTIRHVILPTYGFGSDYSDKISACTQTPYGNWTYLRAFDESNQKLWEEVLQYKVTLLKQDFHSFVRDVGALNCLVNVIERRYP